MNDALFHDRLATLVFAAAISCSVSIAGLSMVSRRFWRAFWQMIGFWGVMHAVAASFALLVGPLPISDMSPVLRFHTGLDGVLIAVGAILCTRPSPRWSGYGLAVVIEGVFLLILDAYFWQKCERLLG